MKLPRHIVIPACIFVYFCVMAYIGRDMLLVEHNYLMYFGIIVVELTVIIALFFFLRKRDKLRKERIDDINRKNNPQE